MARGRRLDNYIEVVTPENIAFDYRLAGPFQRLWAYVIDQLLMVFFIAFAAFAVMFAFSTAGLSGVGVGGILIIWFVTTWFYGGLFETFWNGQTPGKRAMHLRVVSTTGQPINALQAVMRNILRSVDSLPVFPFEVPASLYMVGLISCALTRRYQRLGDLACGTMVVIEQTETIRGIARHDDRKVIELAAALPVQFSVGRSLAQALAMYVERRRHLTPARRAEVARHLSVPLIERFGLPPQTDPDLLLCSLYHRTFVAENVAEAPAGAAAVAVARSSAAVPTMRV